MGIDAWCPWTKAKVVKQNERKASHFHVNSRLFFMEAISVGGVTALLSKCQACAAAVKKHLDSKIPTVCPGSPSRLSWLLDNF